MRGDDAMAFTDELLTCIRQRRSIRKFTEEQISPEQLDALLDAARWAPSGANNQNWFFTAIQKKDVLDHLNDLVRDAFVGYVPEDDSIGKNRIKTRSQTEGYHFCHRAPTLIIASNLPSNPDAIADCALALQNIFLTAQSMGLGSCYINYLHWLRNDSVVRAYLAEFGIPREHTICSSAAIGYIAAEFPAPERKENTINIIR